jgi:ribosomal protein S18 acetylase RimI-like enzyme
MDIRIATRTDVQEVAVTLTGAFANDPVWGWVFPDPAPMEVWWRFWADPAIAQGWVHLTPTPGAAAVWLPPGGTELFAEDEAHLAPLAQALVSDRSATLLETMDTFEANRPTEVPHFYLTLLGTAPDQRGRGLGMALLAAGLERIDAQREPAYLESSNPVNIPRYESVGFESIGEFRIPGSDAPVTQMWRASR